MKKIALVLSILLMGMACKKDIPLPKKAFEDITLVDIKYFESKFSSNKIVLTDDAGNQVIGVGAVILYKTNQNVLGKFKISNISDQHVLTIDLLNYDPNGNVILNKSGVTISNTWLCDLDLGQQTSDSLLYDFWWGLATVNRKEIKPSAAAKFYVYSK